MDVGAVVEGIDFGNQSAMPAEIHGIKWNDVDGDGIRDWDDLDGDGLKGAAEPYTEPGVPGVDICYIFFGSGGGSGGGGAAAFGLASGAAIGGSACTVTDANGEYAFVGLSVGGYQLDESAPISTVQTFPPFGNSQFVELGNGEVRTGVDFGNATPGEIHGFKWDDLDGDGLRDPGEPGLAGILIHLFRLNPPDDEGRFQAETFTMADNPLTPGVNETGMFSFTDLPPGYYRVEEFPQYAFAGSSQTYPAGGRPHFVHVDAGQVVTGVNFGNRRVLPGQITGFKFNDINRNGVKNAGEPGIGRVRICIAFKGMCDTTDLLDGSYSFEDVPPGTYTVYETLDPGPTGLTHTTPISRTVTVVSGGLTNGVNFGNALAGAPPPEVTVGPSSWTYNGLPVVYWGSPITVTKDVTSHCGAGSALAVRLTIEFTETGGSVTMDMVNAGGEVWSATFAPFFPEHGIAHLSFTVDCNDDGVYEEFQDGGNIYIDPSGFITDSCTGGTLPGATVTLLKESPPGSGNFVIPVGGDHIPADNPQFSDAFGHYGWDVVPGLYKVRVGLAGYITALSPAVTIPPAVFDLNIALVPTAGCVDVNDAPSADDDNYSTLEDITLVVPAPGVLDGDTDPELDTLTAELVLGSGPIHGDLVLNGDGSFTYQPDAQFSGFDSFRYRAFDGSLYSQEATVSITISAVNDDPGCSNVPIITNEDTLVIRNLAPSCFDPDGGSIVEIEIVALSLKGSVSVVSPPSTTVRYTPFLNENGPDRFTFRAKNSLGRPSNIATANVSIAPVNDPPDARGDTANTVEDSGFIDIDVLGNDTDPDFGKPFDSIRVVSATDPRHGVTLAIGNADGGFVKYKPDPNFNGTDTFQYTIRDNAGVQDTATVTVNVAGVNDPPTIDAHGNESAEATRPSGASVSFTSPAAQDAEDGDLSTDVVCNPGSGSTFALGVTSVECSVTDSGGLSASSFFDVFVVDTTPPTVDGKATVFAEATGPDGAVVTYAPPVARDLVDGNFAATCNPASGGLFPLGLTSVRCYARDVAGNASADSFFDVFVEDTTPPDIEPHENIHVVTTNPDGVVVDYTPPATHDIVDGDGVADCVPALGSTFPSGNNTRVRCVATDGAGNFAESFFDIFVELDLGGNNPPIVTPQDNATVESLRVALYTIGTFTDDSGDTHAASVRWGDGRSQSVGVNEATGEIDDARHVYLAPGTYQVEVEVCDQHGECASAFFDVFVQITEPFIKVDFREITFFKNKDVIGSSDPDIQAAWGLPSFNPDDPAQWSYHPGGGHDKTKSRPTKFRIYGFSSSAAGIFVSNADGTAYYEVVADPDIAGAYYVDIGGPGMVLIAVSDLQLSQLQRGGGHVDRDTYPGTTRLTDAQRNVAGIHLAHNRDKIEVPKRVREELSRLGAPLLDERGRKTSKAYIDYVGFQLWGHGASKYKEFVDVEVSLVHDAVDHYKYGFHTVKNVNFEGLKGCGYHDSRPGDDTSRFNDVWEGKHPTWGKACGPKENRHNQSVRANYDVPLNAVQLLSSVNTGDDTLKIFFGKIRGTIP